MHHMFTSVLAAYAFARTGYHRGLDALLDGRGRDADGSGGVDGPGGRA